MVIPTDFIESLIIVFIEEKKGNNKVSCFVYVSRRVNNGEFPIEQYITNHN